MRSFSACMLAHLRLLDLSSIIITFRSLGRFPRRHIDLIYQWRTDTVQQAIISIERKTRYCIITERADADPVPRRLACIPVELKPQDENNPRPTISGYVCAISSAPSSLVHGICATDRSQNRASDLASFNDGRPPTPPPIAPRSSIVIEAQARGLAPHVKPLRHHRHHHWATRLPFGPEPATASHRTTDSATSP